MDVRRESNTGTSFFAKLDGVGGEALVDSLHPSLWLLQAPLAASYSVRKPRKNTPSHRVHHKPSFDSTGAMGGTKLEVHTGREWSTAQ